MYLYWTI